MTSPRRLYSLLPPVLAVLALVGGTAMWWDKDVAARREANQFIQESLARQEGRNWDRLGRYMLFDYRFEDAGCTLVATRNAEFGEDFKQIIPLALARPVGMTDSEIVFRCPTGRPCITHHSYSLRENEDRPQTESRLLVMDEAALNPVASALVELHRMCSDPYGSQTSKR